MTVFMYQVTNFDIFIKKAQKTAICISKQKYGFFSLFSASSYKRQKSTKIDL